MEIIYISEDVEELLNNPRELQRLYGKDVAQKVRKRLSDIKDAKDMWDLINFPGKFEPLTGDRHGQYTMRLDRRLRLLMVRAEGDTPTACILGIDDPHQKKG